MFCLSITFVFDFNVCNFLVGFFPTPISPGIETGFGFNCLFGFFNGFLFGISGLSPGLKDGIVNGSISGCVIV